MATTETELKKLNKTVEEAVNVIKVVYGNSAQIKNMNEKQREAISKWFDVVEYEEETAKKQRAFTEREREDKGKFIKKQEGMALNFMGIAKSISGMFKGIAIGIGNSIKGIAQGIMSKLGNLFGAIKGHFLGLFGEESEWFNLLGVIKDAVGGVFSWLWKGFMRLFKTPKWASKMLKLLGGIFHWQKKQSKLGLLDERGKKKKGVLGIIGMLLGGLVSSIAGAITRLVKLPIFKKIFRHIKRIKFGFRWIAWPLVVILGLIDFIK